MAKIIVFNGQTKLDIPPKDVIEGAAKEDFDQVLVIGWIGDELYMSSSSAEGSDILWLLERVKHFLMCLVSYSEEE
jgi:hypothetical protein